jgi:CheY-like chemotaxis protein
MSNTLASKPLLDVSVLIVEDEPLIALDLHETLRKAGASIIASTTIDDALSLIRYADISVALLDINLGGRDCSAVCEALAHKSIPFMFHTAQVLPDIKRHWPRVPALIKPADDDCIIATLANLAGIALGEKRAET